MPVAMNNEQLNNSENNSDEWTILKIYLDYELGSIKTVTDMPLSKWIRFDDEEMEKIYSNGYPSRLFFRDNDQRVLSVIKMKNDSEKQFKEVEISDSLRYNILNVFLNPSQKLEHSDFMLRISPPNFFPRDSIG